MPHLKVKITKPQQDAWLFMQFTNVQAAGFDPMWSISRRYPELAELLRKNKDTEVKRFVQNWHKMHRRELQDNKEDFEKAWKRIENDFFSALENLFRVKIKKNLSRLSFPWCLSTLAIYISTDLIFHTKI